MNKAYQDSYNKRHVDIQKILIERFSGGGLESYIKSDELTIIIDKSNLIKVISFLKEDKDFQFKQLIDICGVDYPNRLERFEIVYHC